MRLAKIFESARLVLERPTPKRVYRVQFAVTWRCQLACEMCNIWRKPKDDEMSLDDIKKIFSNRRFLKSLRTIDITGGEPFLRSDLAQIVEYFATEFPKANILITTNGYSTDLIERLGRKVLDACPADKLEFSISIDGPEEIHDKIRGREGSYRNALESISILKRLGAKKVTLSTTIIKKNRDKLLRIYELARELGVEFSTARFAQSSFYYEKPIFNAWSRDELKDVEKEIEALIKVRKKREGVSLKLLRDSYFLRKAVAHCHSEQSKESCHQKQAGGLSPLSRASRINADTTNSSRSGLIYQTQNRRIQNRRCFSGTHSFFVDPRANVYPCIMLDKPIGNALDEDLEKIWFSEKACEIRRYIANGNCTCHTECETFLSMRRNAKDVLKTLLGALKT